MLSALSAAAKRCACHHCCASSLQRRHMQRAVPAAAAAAAAAAGTRHVLRLRPLLRTAGASSPRISRPSRLASSPAAPAAAAAAAGSGSAMAATPAPPAQLSATKWAGGYVRRYKHASPTLSCDMTFSVFFPPGTPGGGAADAAAAMAPPPSPSRKAPVLWYLSGLTCTDENVIIKSGVQRPLAEHGLAFVAPDTSPRGLGVEGEADSWDFGVGAGFYVNATEPKWAAWRMYDYITQELPALLAAHFPQLDTANASIMGHSMGGHGALTIALKHPGAFKSVSAFAPICNPCAVPWGIKAFTGYFGEANKELWAAHDASELVKQYAGPALPTLIDTGTADSFLERELKPEVFEAAAKQAGFPVTMRMQEGYDHSYAFMASFIHEHVAFHARALKGQ